MLAENRHGTAFSDAFFIHLDNGEFCLALWELFCEGHYYLGNEKNCAWMLY